MRHNNSLSPGAATHPSQPRFTQAAAQNSFEQALALTVVGERKAALTLTLLSAEFEIRTFANACSPREGPVASPGCLGSSNTDCFPALLLDESLARPQQTPNSCARQRPEERLERAHEGVDQGPQAVSRLRRHKTFGPVKVSFVSAWHSPCASFSGQVVLCEQVLQSCQGPHLAVRSTQTPKMYSEHQAPTNFRGSFARTGLESQFHACHAHGAHA